MRDTIKPVCVRAKFSSLDSVLPKQRPHTHLCSYSRALCARMGARAADQKAVTLPPYTLPSRSSNGARLLPLQIQIL